MAASFSTQSTPTPPHRQGELSEQTVQDLLRSGLTIDTALAAGISDGQSSVETARLLARHRLQPTEGYVIPYFSLSNSAAGNGGPEFYRIRCFDAKIKYIQPAKSGSHVYIPPTLPASWKDPNTPLIITEGEKKALKAVQEGFPAIALGGVWNWRTKTLTVPEEAVADMGLLRGQGRSPKVTISLSDAKAVRQFQDLVAPELLDITWQSRQVVLIFDTDHRPESAVNVQQAAFEFALWLEQQGAQVGQLKLPLLGNPKQGLDDFLVQAPEHKAWLARQLSQASALPFPAAAAPKEYVIRQLDAATPATRHAVNRRVARNVIAALDANGQRYRDLQGYLYYFDHSTLLLHRFNFSELGQSTFGDLLHSRFSLSRADTDAMAQLADMYTATQPCPTIVPRRVIANTPNAIYYQLSDSKVARVTANSIDVVNNGTDEQLFLSGCVKPIDIAALRRHLASSRLHFPRAVSQEETPVGPTPYSASQAPWKPLWLETLETVNLQPMSGLTLDQTRRLLTCLFYMSPWLLRWRNTQLPLEIAVAEPNSGKTFLYNLRKGILTGIPSLQGMPNDFRAFVSSLQSANALWVCDNLGHTNREYWEKLNDELARLITDPEPSIELRQLYTTATVSRIPVQCTFAVTSIRNPLTKPDLIQRSLIFELQAIPAGKRNSNWYDAQLRRREEFIAEHLTVLQLFMQRVAEHWDPNYLSGYRLMNFEQSLVHMGHVLGFQDDIPRIVKALPGLVTSTIAEADTVIQALQQFANEYRGKTVQVSDIVAWALADMTETYSSNATLTNTIRLGRYIKSHADDIRTITGITYERKNNTTFLTVPS